jgi:hypothetical protein
VEVPGAEVRRHAFRDDALVITPSAPLAGQSSVPVLVPLVDGVVALTLSFSPERTDTRVRVVRRATSGRPAVTDTELRGLLCLALRTALDPKACPGTDRSAGPREVAFPELDAFAATGVVGPGGFAYVSVVVPADCRAAVARLTRGEESADAILFQQATAQAQAKRIRSWVVARVPHGEGGELALEFLAPDGRPCSRVRVDLTPASP